MSLFEYKYQKYMNKIELLQKGLGKNGKGPKEEDPLVLEYKKFSLTGFPGDVTFDEPITRLKTHLDLILADRDTVKSKLKILQGPINRVMNQYTEKKMYQDGALLSEKILSAPFDWPIGMLTMSMNFYYQKEDLDNMIRILTLIDGKSQSDPKFKIHQRELRNILDLCAKVKDQAKCKPVLEIGFRNNVVFEEKDFINMITLYHDNPDEIRDLIIKMSRTIPEITPENFDILKEIFAKNNKKISPALIDHVAKKCNICNSDILEFSELIQNRDQILTLVDQYAEKEINKKQENLHTGLRRGYIKAKNDVKAKMVDFIIDGANVGYYRLSSRYAQLKIEGTAKDDPIDYSKLEALASYIQSLDKTYIIILHSRHTIGAQESLHKQQIKKTPKSPKLPINQAIIENNKIIAQHLAGNIIFTPHNFADDIVWMYASIYMTLRFPHPKTFVITNDEVRNHLNDMDKNKILERWADTHNIGYNINLSNKVIFENPQILNQFISSIQYNDVTKRLHIPIKGHGIVCVEW